VNKLVIFLVVLLLILQYQLWAGDGGLLDVWDLHQEVAALKQENERLQERNAALDAEVLDLKQGLDAIEEHAREDLGMVKKGETFYQIVE